MHAVLFEAVPLYLLEVHGRRLDWPMVRDAAASLDLDPLRLPYPGVEPFHFRSGRRSIQRETWSAWRSCHRNVHRSPTVSSPAAGQAT